MPALCVTLILNLDLQGIDNLYSPENQKVVEMNKRNSLDCQRINSCFKNNRKTVKKNP